jgi:hypothetical protein
MADLLRQAQGHEDPAAFFANFNVTHLKAACKVAGLRGTSQFHKAALVNVLVAHVRGGGGVAAAAAPVPHYAIPPAAAPAAAAAAPAVNQQHLQYVQQLQQQLQQQQAIRAHHAQQAAAAAAQHQQRAADPAAVAAQRLQQARAHAVRVLLQMGDVDPATAAAAANSTESFDALADPPMLLFHYRFGGAEGDDDESGDGAARLEEVGC